MPVARIFSRFRNGGSSLRPFVGIGLISISAGLLVNAAPRHTRDSHRELGTNGQSPRNIISGLSSTVSYIAAQTGDLFAWGYNGGRLGDGTNTSSSTPVATDVSGALSGKTVTAISAGWGHSTAVTSDGKVFAWGSNTSGEVGDGTNTSPRLTPVATDMSGALSGKIVTKISAGFMHTVALTSDGKVFAWGAGGYGQLGDGTTTGHLNPVAVDMSGVLAGKTVTAISTSNYHTLALTSDGKIFAWGRNLRGELGDGTTTERDAPVAVDMSGALAGKIVTAISAGWLHSTAVTSDGKVFAWGDNEVGQLGNGTVTDSLTPTAVNMSGALAGKTVTAVSAGTYHTVALTSDGKIFAWGFNFFGELGDGTTVERNSPVAVNISGALSGKTVTAISTASGSGYHTMALTSDGKAFAWGRNDNGQLGDGTTTNHSNPVAVDMSGALSGKTVRSISGGNAHTEALAGSPPMQLLGLEVTQGVQDLNNSVKVVEHKKTVVRAHVKDPTTNSNVVKSSATLTAKNPSTGAVLGVIKNSNIGKEIKIPKSPVRTSAFDSFEFEVPPALKTGTVEFTFAGEQATFDCPSGFAGDCHKATVSFLPVNPLSIKFLKFIYQDADGLSHTTTNADVERIKKEFLGRYPINLLDTAVESVLSSFDACIDANFTPILTEISDLRNSDCRSGPCKDYYQGLFADQSLCIPATKLNGQGELPGHVSAAFVKTDDTTSRIHEEGHVLGFNHTKFNGKEACENFLGITVKCSSLEGDGTLSLSKSEYGHDTVFGYDINSSSSQIIYPPQTPDFMSYGRPRWPSRTNYNLLVNKFAVTSPVANAAPALAQLSANQTVIIDGTAQINGTAGQIGSVIVNEMPVNVELPSAGPFSIRFEDSQGTELTHYSFNAVLSSENSAVTGISLLLPWDPATKRIVLLYNGNVLDSRQASAHSPTVNLTFPNGGETLNGTSATFTWTGGDLDGDILRYTLEYSADNGSTWETLAINRAQQSLPVDLTTLHGSNQALVRVTASDGLNCTMTQSQATFTVPDHSPMATIYSPDTNRLFVGDQLVILEGSASDPEDGSLSESQLSWSSDLNGSLGTGSSLAIDASTLQEGTHTITLATTDSAGHVATDSISIQVSRTRPTLVATLSAVPLDLTFRLTESETASRTVAVRNGGDGNLDWTAASDQTWLQVATGNGSAPSNLEIVALPTGLAIGEYTGHVTITASGAADSPQIINVTLLVTETPIPTIVAVSRKTHGTAGVFDIELPLDGGPGVECRNGGATGDYQLVVRFANSVAVTGNPQAQITSGTAQIGSAGTGNGGAVTVSENIVAIPLTNVTNAQTIIVTLAGVDDGTNVTNIPIPMSILVGDTNADKFTDAVDVAQTKSQSGNAVSNSNFREDVNVDGFVDAVDAALVKSKSGTALP